MEKLLFQSLTINASFLCDDISITAENDYLGNYAFSIDNGFTWSPSVNLTKDENGNIINSNILISFQPQGTVVGDLNLIIIGQNTGTTYKTIPLTGRSRAFIFNQDLSYDRDQDGNLILSWRSSGDGEEVLVLIQEHTGGSSGGYGMWPSDINQFTTAIANNSYGLGSAVQMPNDAYLVYKENQIPEENTPTQKLTITNLSLFKKYNIRMFIKSADGNYLNGVSAFGDEGYFGTPTYIITSFREFNNPIVLWDFNNRTLIPSVGSNIATLSSIGVGVTTSYLSTTNSSATDPTSPTYLLAVAGKTSGTIINKTYGIQININTSGKENIIIYWDNYITASSTKYLALQYTLDRTGGSPIWLDYTPQINDISDTSDSISDGLFVTSDQTSWHRQRKADFTEIFGVSNNPNFALRIVGSWAPSKNGYDRADGTNTTPLSYFGGTFRFDMIIVVGNDA